MAVVYNSRSKSHPASKFNPPPTTTPGIFLSLLIFPCPIIHFKHQYFYFKLKLITNLKSANRVTHTHLVLRTTFHNKQMMSSSGALVLSFHLIPRRHQGYSRRLLFWQGYLPKSSRQNLFVPPGRRLRLHKTWIPRLSEKWTDGKTRRFSLTIMYIVKHPLNTLNLFLVQNRFCFVPCFPQ